MSKWIKHLRYRGSNLYQGILWVFGKSIHNNYAGECCPDFSCCEPDLKTKGFIKRLKIFMRDEFNVIRVIMECRREEKLNG